MLYILQFQIIGIFLKLVIILLLPRRIIPVFNNNRQSIENDIIFPETRLYSRLLTMVASVQAIV